MSKPDKTRNITIRLRVSYDEMKMFDRVCTRLGMTVSEMIRAVVLESDQKVTRKEEIKEALREVLKEQETK